LTVVGDVGLSVTDPHGADVPVTTDAVQNNSFKIGFQPSQPGIYDANVYFGDEQVPGSPFKVPDCSLIKAKFHYTSWFGAGSKLQRAEIWPII